MRLLVKLMCVNVYLLAARSCGDKLYHCGYRSDTGTYTHAGTINVWCFGGAGGCSCCFRCGRTCIVVVV